MHIRFELDHQPSALDIGNSSRGVQISASDEHTVTEEAVWLLKRHYSA